MDGEKKEDGGETRRGSEMSALTDGDVCWSCQSIALISSETLHVFRWNGSFASFRSSAPRFTHLYIHPPVRPLRDEGPC